MKLNALITESLQSLRTNVLRSTLTITGIVVGIFSVTAMLALGEGLSNNILNRFSSFSTGDVSISGDLYTSDYEWLAQRPYTKTLLATQSSNGATVLSSGESFDPEITAYRGNYVGLKQPELAEGSLYDFEDVTLDEAIAVIDTNFQEAVIDATNTDPFQEGITINGKHFDVVGVIQASSSNFGRRGDGTILVPIATSTEYLTGTETFSSIGVSLLDQSYYEIVAQNILESLNASRYAAVDSTDFFSVTSAQDAIENALETTQMLTLFLGIIGGITLFVGGIGTMNMMLTSVTERTKEIGLRKAIGARNRDILNQVLVESVVLTVVGGIIGIVLAFLGSSVANELLANNDMIQVIMSWRVVVLAVFVSIVVGVIFGYYPARNAARLAPADALRAD